jgi:pentatricopeptide repeat protein
MKVLRVPLGAAAYNSMVAALSELGELDTAVKYLNEYKRTGQVIPIEFYQTILVLYGKLGHVTEMEQIYERVTQTERRHCKAEKTLMLLNALMSGYSYAGSWKKVWVLWNHLRSNSTLYSLPNPIQINGNVFTNIGSDITTRYFGVNAVTVCVIIDALGFSKQLQRIRMVWKDLLGSNFPFVLNNLTSLTEALIRCGQYDEAVELVLQLKDKYGMEPDAKMIRNTLALLPEPRISSARQELISKYPAIAPSISLNHIGKLAIEFPPKTDDGLSLKHFKDRFTKKKSIPVLFPPIQELVEK